MRTHSPVVLLRTVCVAEVAEIVVAPQVLEQLIVVKVTVIAELAEWVAAVAGVVRVTVRPMPRQLLAVVPLPLVGEDLGGSGVMGCDGRCGFYDLFCLKMLQAYNQTETVGKNIYTHHHRIWLKSFKYDFFGLDL